MSPTTSSYLDSAVNASQSAASYARSATTALSGAAVSAGSWLGRTIRNSGAGDPAAGASQVADAVRDQVNVDGLKDGAASVGAAVGEGYVSFYAIW